MSDREYDFTNKLDLVRCCARERYAWPGGYEICLIMKDGTLLCSKCVRDNYRIILDSTKKYISDEWQCIGITNESDIEDCLCSHCSVSLGYDNDEKED